jgi:solute carrier family 30 (zinc transporter), member 5/7
LVNVVGVAFFHEFHVSHANLGDAGGEDCDCCEIGSGAQDNMKGVFLHVLADTLSSVGVIISALLIKCYGWTSADPICSVFISTLILVSVKPLLDNTMKTLALQAPAGLSGQESLVEDLLALPSVRAVRDPHVWKVSGSLAICSVRILIDEATNEQRILVAAARVCKKAGYRDVSIQVEYSAIHVLEHLLSNYIVKAR